MALTPVPANDNEPVKRLNEATAVFSEIMATPDKGIPQEMPANAHCIVIVPGLKTAALLVGGKYGKASCRAGIRAELAGRPRARSASRAAA